MKLVCAEYNVNWKQYKRYLKAVKAIKKIDAANETHILGFVDEYYEVLKPVIKQINSLTRYENIELTLNYHPMSDIRYIHNTMKNERRNQKGDKRKGNR
jgi:hypothetical protein